MKMMVFIVLNFILDKYCEYLNSRAWPLVKKAVEKGLKNWDADGDCLIENSGHPDQVCYIRFFE